MKLRRGALANVSAGNSFGVGRRDRRDGDLAQVPRGDRAFAVADDLHLRRSSSSMVRREVSAAVYFAQRVTSLHRAVAEVGPHEHLLLVAGLERSTWGGTTSMRTIRGSSSFGRRRAGRRSTRPARGTRASRARTSRRPCAGRTPVGFCRSRLADGSCGTIRRPMAPRVRAAPVALVVVAAQRQLEPVLPRGRAVAGAAAAAELGEHGLDVVAEAVVKACPARLTVAAAGRHSVVADERRFDVHDSGTDEELHPLGIAVGLSSRLRQERWSSRRRASRTAPSSGFGVHWREECATHARGERRLALLAGPAESTSCRSTPEALW